MFTPDLCLTRAQASVSERGSVAAERDENVDRKCVRWNTIQNEELVIKIKPVSMY